MNWGPVRKSDRSPSRTIRLSQPKKIPNPIISAGGASDFLSHGFAHAVFNPRLDIAESNVLGLDYYRHFSGQPGTAPKNQFDSIHLTASMMKAVDMQQLGTLAHDDLVILTVCHAV